MYKLLLLLFVLSFVGGAFSKNEVQSSNPSNDPDFKNKMPPSDDQSATVPSDDKSKSLSSTEGEDHKANIERPWIAAICNESPCNFKSVVCEGSLISERFILTTAHCAKELTAPEIIVSLGKNNLASSSMMQSEEYQATQIITHKLYNSVTSRNDIALIELKSKVNITDDISPICLAPEGSSYKELTAYLYTWEQISSSSRSQSKILKEIPLRVLSNRECEFSADKITKKRFCATGEDSDSCQGGSGSPLVYKDSNGYYELIGILTSTQSCAEPQHPILFVKVKKYLKWIQNSMTMDTFCTNA